MLQMVPKWKVTLRFADRDNVVFWIYENHVSEVMRKIAGMQFTESGLDQPCEISINAVA